MEQEKRTDRHEPIPYLACPNCRKVNGPDWCELGMDNTIFIEILKFCKACNQWNTRIEWLRVPAEVVELDEPSTCGCGIPWLWQLAGPYVDLNGYYHPGHPFHPACVKHDDKYDLLKPGDSTEQIDEEFMDDMMEIAGDSFKLQAQAYLFYSLARAWGVAKQALKRPYAKTCKCSHNVYEGYIERWHGDSDEGTEN